MINTSYLNDFNSLIRQITGKVELLGSSTVTQNGEIIGIDKVVPYTKINTKVSSKNLIPYPYYNGEAYAHRNVNFTVNSDGSITANGTNSSSTGNATFYLIHKDSNFTLDEGDYVFSAAGSNDVCYCGIEIRKADSDAYIDGGNTSEGSFTFTANRKVNVRIYFIVKPTQTADNITVYPQLEKGTVATPYAPYVADITTATITKYGKNLIPFPYPETNNPFNGVTYKVNNDGSIYTSGSTSSDQSWYTLKGNLRFPAGKYILSGCPPGSDGDTYRLYLLRNGSYDFADNGLGNGAIVTLAGDENVTIQLTIYANKNVDGLTFYPMLRLMDTDGTYEPPTTPTTYTPKADGTVEIEGYCKGSTLIASTGATMETSYITNEYKAQYLHTDNLKSIKIDRQGENGKFFGFGVAQKATINLLDKNREIDITTTDAFKTFFKINNNDYENNFPTFYVSDTKRDENTNELTITAEDLLFAAAGHTIAEAGLQGATILDYAEAIATIMGLEVVIEGLGTDTVFTTPYENGANYEGSESFREVLNDIAEATQTIYYISGDNLVFKRLDSKAAANLVIEKQHYFTLKDKEPQVLSAICHTTELGDDVISTSIGSGITQYVRDNAFWEKATDIASVVENAISAIGGISIVPFDCSWRGNFLLDIGDKIDITTKDNNTITTYFLNDTITYNGGYSQVTKWEAGETKTQTANPSTLGEVIKQTFAKVDKVNKQIDLVASESSTNKSDIAAIKLDTDSISNTVSDIESKVNSQTGAIETLSTKVNSVMTNEQIMHTITTELEKGTDKVATSTGFTFDKDGLHISNSESEMKTQITEDGMKVFKDNDLMLDANNKGVDAVNLHATTYLIIGTNSRFEDYGDNRTGCFWIGG